MFIVRSCQELVDVPEFVVGESGDESGEGAFLRLLCTSRAIVSPFDLLDAISHGGVFGRYDTV